MTIQLSKLIDMANEMSDVRIVLRQLFQNLENKLDSSDYDVDSYNIQALKKELSGLIDQAGGTIDKIDTNMSDAVSKALQDFTSQNFQAEVDSVSQYIFNQKSITHASSTDDLNKLTPWDGRLVYVDNFGLYEYSNANSKWIRHLIPDAGISINYDYSTQQEFNQAQVGWVDTPESLANLTELAHRQVYVSGKGHYQYTTDSGWTETPNADVKFVETVDQLSSLSTWEGRTVNIHNVGNYTFTNGSWVKQTVATNITDAATQDLVNQKATTNVAAIADLKSLATWDNRTVYVKSIGQNYIYHTNNQEAENGVTVVSNWVMEVPESYYASWFADTTAATNQAPSLRVGYAYAVSKGKPFVIDKPFNVLADYNSQNAGNELCAISLISNSILSFSPEGVLNKIAGSETNYNLLMACNNVTNITLNGPVINGDRLNHTYTTGSTHEWGYGLVIHECSDVIINNPKITNCTGDGIYIGKSWADTTTDVPTRVQVLFPIVDRCRRNGIGFTSGTDVYIKKPIVSNINDIDGITATAPKSGMDIEPENGAHKASFTRCIVEDFTSIDSGIGLNFWVQSIDAKVDVRMTGQTKLYSSSLNNTLFWFQDENSADSKIMIDELCLMNKTNSPIAWYKYADNPILLHIKKLNNLSGDYLDIIFNSAKNDSNGNVRSFGNLIIDELSTNDILSTASGYNFALSNSSNTSAYFNIIINKVTCNLGQWGSSYFKKGANFFINNIVNVQATNTDQILTASTINLLAKTSNDGVKFGDNDLSIVKVVADPMTDFSVTNVASLVFNLNILVGQTKYTSVGFKKGGDSVRLSKNTIYDASGQYTLYS
ncbi:hypothetical protein [Acinetobacter nectaris]|uniref:hypothetical protein n=1 Tax=Acinetobacter nectaris TaxID=1219382 RepID=UPI001F26D076|nr:hypothetical protein [Acinetobacter nectaris]MCF9034183.1 hypothetical protein [Acinetobacter nectaris]